MSLMADRAGGRGNRLFLFASQNPSQVTLKDVERTGEQVEDAFGLSRVEALAGQPFDALALARNNVPPFDNVANGHFPVARFHQRPHKMETCSHNSKTFRKLIKTAQSPRSGEHERYGRFGARSVLTCPDCGGLIWQLKDRAMSTDAISATPTPTKCLRLGLMSA
jgi:hypothetical protein